MSNPRPRQSAALGALIQTGSAASALVKNADRKVDLPVL
jgi:hypothetical protein